MNSHQCQKPKIGIIGAGFSGTALAAALHKINSQPLEILLFDKSGRFGTGDAYSTPFPFHFLNVRAQDMSAYEDEPHHFTAWLSATNYTGMEPSKPIHEQFAARALYGEYLQGLLKKMSTDVDSVTKLSLLNHEVVDAERSHECVHLTLKDGSSLSVDKVVIATGNTPSHDFPFEYDNSVQLIMNPWDYHAPTFIPSHDPVLIVGTGLSMIDAVLTLFNSGHQGPIYAISRRGLIPLPHADIKVPYLFLREHLPTNIKNLTTVIRSKTKAHLGEGGDWRSVVNALRAHLPDLWHQSSLKEKKRFLRHVLPYWNIHRHRVHNKVASMLEDLISKKQLTILAGRIQQVKNQSASIQLRGSEALLERPVKWVINCMGPALNIKQIEPTFVKNLHMRGLVSIDELQIGFRTTLQGALLDQDSQASDTFFAVGPQRKATTWETSAVPEIRKQCFELANHLILNLGVYKD